MNLRLIISLVALAGVGALGGCVHTPDVMIRNPLTARVVDQNRVLKLHDYIERQRGLPDGSVADEAQMLTADGSKLCFAVTLHELDPIDLNSVDAKVVDPKVDATVDAPQVWPEPATFTTYQGLIPERRETGSETVCTSRDQYNNCLAWQTRPIYSTVWIRGAVNVYQARGRMCFANRGVATPVTEQVALELRLRRLGENSATVGLFGSTSKMVVFRWGFLNPLPVAAAPAPVPKS